MLDPVTSAVCGVLLLVPTLTCAWTEYQRFLNQGRLSLFHTGFTAFICLVLGGIAAILFFPAVVFLTLHPIGQQISLALALLAISAIGGVSLMAAVESRMSKDANQKVFSRFAIGVLIVWYPLSWQLKPLPEWGFVLMFVASWLLWFTPLGYSLSKRHQWHRPQTQVKLA